MLMEKRSEKITLMFCDIRLWMFTVPFWSGVNRAQRWIPRILVVLLKLLVTVIAGNLPVT